MIGPLLIMVLIFSAATLLWLVSLVLKDSSVVDVFWAPFFALIAWLSALGHPVTVRSVFVLALVSLWALRLALHIALRHRGEDRRYAAMRAKAGATWWWRSLLQVFWLQALLAFAISWPLQLAVASSVPVGPLDAAGALVAATGFIIEALADLQLTRFRADPANAGKVMDRGLWSWSRHPNYFGDALMWWGFFLMGLAAPGAWWTVLCPLAMTILLLRVSGVSLLEETIVDRRPKYAGYIERTSAFIPWPPTSTPPR
jgi:steroid 5-alpha reductase family enzyme